VTGPRAARHLRFVVVAAALAWAMAAPLLAAPRLLAIGDVHGSAEGLRAILRETGLIDAAGTWRGGDAALVQTGDLLDRGTAVREVMDLLMRLQGEAAAAGGEVVVLLGNHEQMNLVHFFRDVNPEVYASFAADESKKERKQAYARWKEWVESAPAPQAGRREEFDRLFPPGYLAYQRALGPGGHYGRWLRSLPVAAVRGGFLFLHAGLSPAWLEPPLAAIEARHTDTFARLDEIRRELTERAGVPEVLGFFELFDALGRLVAVERGPGGELSERGRRLAGLAAELEASQWMNAADAPLWFRGYAEWDDEQLAPHVAAVRARHGVAHVVAAHSTSATATIRPRLDGAVFLIDTGMLAAVYRGRPAALEVQEAGVFAVYPGERTLLVAKQAALPATAPAPGAAGAGAPVAAADEPPGANSTAAPTAAAAARPPRELRGSDGQPAPFASAEEAKAFLREAEVVSHRPIGEGVTGALKVQLRRGDLQLAAAFHSIDTTAMNLLLGKTRHLYFIDSWRGQVAAYELAQLLGLDTVPPSVERRIGSRKGSLQLWVGEATSWKRLKEGGEEAPWPGHLSNQWHDMYVFDNLINNRDRNQGNVLIDRGGYLWWIDHTRCFDRQVALPTPHRLRRVSRPFWDALERLDPAQVHERLRPWFGRFEIDALLARRELVLTTLRTAIADKGERRVLFEGDGLPLAAVTEGDGCADAACEDLEPPPPAP
jgi:hypothetical protein